MFHPQKNILVSFIGLMIVISIIPLIVVGYISFQTGSEAIKNAEYRYARTILESKSEQLLIQLQQVESLIANISGVEEIVDALDDMGSVPDNYTQLSTQARIGYILNGYLNLEGLISIDIFTEGDAHYQVGETLDISSVREDVVTFITENTRKSDHQVYWAGVVPNVNTTSRQDKVLTASRIIYVLDRKTLKQRPVATIIVSYSLDHIADQFEHISLLPGSQFVLLDQFHNVIYQNSPDVSVSFMKSLHSDREVNNVIQQGSERYIIQHIDIAPYNWHMMNVVPETTLLSGVIKIKDSTVSLVIIGLILVAFLGWLFLRKILDPVKSVIDGFKLLEKNNYNLDNRLPVKGSDELSQLVSWFNTFLDTLSARTASDKALAESQKRYELAVNASHESLWDWNLEDNMLYLSPRFRLLLGEVVSSSIGETVEPSVWLDRIHPDDKSLLEMKLKSHLQGNTPYFESEYRIRQADGSYKWILSHGLAELNNDSKPKRMAGSHTDINDRKIAELRLSHDAFYDNLTGLHNRSWFLSYLDQKIEISSRQRDQQFAVLFIDLDKFKIVNDTLGHSVGDQLLREVSERLKECLRSADILARLGGDEFVMLLESRDVTYFSRVAERIINALNSPFHIANQELKSGASIGISLSNDEYESSDQIIRDADIAMYQAKLSGKNCYVVFDQDMRKHLVEDVQIEQELRTAIQENQFTLYYQPIVELHSGHIVGCEALIRWNHPTRGLLLPGEFIPIAESSNLMHALGIWVFETACKQWSEWRKNTPEIAGKCLSINVSTIQFYDNHLLTFAKNTMHQYGFNRGELAIEITETALIRDTKHAVDVIDQLKKEGLNIHLDDFGTGFSSLKHLTDFTIDKIKIDKSFVMKCADSQKHRRIVNGILYLAHELELSCIAEGIENTEQLNITKKLGCEFGQGFYFDKPLPAEEMKKALGLSSRTKSSLEIE